MCQTIYINPDSQLRPYTLHESAWIIILLHTFLQGELDPEESPLGGSAGHFQLISLPVASGGILLCRSTEAVDSDVRLSNSVFEVLVGFRPTRSV